MKYRVDPYCPHDELEEKLNANTGWTLKEILPVRFTEHTDCVTLVWEEEKSFEEGCKAFTDAKPHKTFTNVVDPSVPHEHYFEIKEVGGDPMCITCGRKVSEI